MPFDSRLPFQRRELPDGVGAALRQARLALGLTRREVAARVGIAPRTLARVERGDQKPLWPSLDRLCDELGVSAATVALRWVSDSFDVPTDAAATPGVGLRALRMARGMSLVEVARLFGVSPATLSRHERGLTASRLLADWPGLDAARDDEVAGRVHAAALALGFADAEALRAACVAAARSG